MVFALLNAKYQSLLGDTLRDAGRPVNKETEAPVNSPEQKV